MLKQQQESVMAAMCYMTHEEREVIVALAKTYVDERANQKKRLTLLLGGLGTGALIPAECRSYDAENRIPLGSVSLVVSANQID